MGYAVELCLEDSTTEAIRKLFELTDSLMLQIKASPHVSLAVFDNVDTLKIIEVVRSFAENTQSFNLRLCSIGIFPGEENVVFLATVVTNDLLMLHKSFHDKLKAAGLSSREFLK